MTSATCFSACLLLSAFCAVDLVGQEVGGPFSSSPLAYSRPNGTNPGQGPEGVFIKPVEFASTGPQEFQTAPLEGVADFRLAAIFPNPQVRNLVDIDGMSTKNDVLPIDDNGVIDFGSGDFDWSIISYSLKAASTPEGKTLQALLDAGLSPSAQGGTQFSYGVLGSQGIDLQYIDHAWVHLTPDQIEVNGNTEVDAADQALPLVVANGGTSDPVFFPNTNQEFYFSLTGASAAAIENLIATQSPGSHRFVNVSEFSGATIYKTSWNSGTLSWGNIQVYRSRATLRLSASADIDALMVTTSDRVVFSLADPTAEQISVEAVVAGQPSNVPLKLPNSGGKVSTHIGVANGTSNIDALCSRDPEAQAFSEFLGTPVQLQGKQFHLSVTLLPHPFLTKTKRVCITVSGWEGLNPALSANVEIGFSQVPGVWTTVPLGVRNAFQQFQYVANWPVFGGSPTESTFIARLTQGSTIAYSVPAKILY